MKQISHRCMPKQWRRTRLFRQEKPFCAEPGDAW
jgi:hypothetical protein